MNRICFFIFFLLTLSSCKKEQSKAFTYMDHIGDTKFNPEVDHESFQFCNANKVLHKRALVKYTGGKKALNKDLKRLYKFQESFKSFNGYAIVRLAVNCNNESGRFRFEYLDDNFELSECPKVLMNHIQDIFRNLNQWNHAKYQEQSYDCYTFRTLKITNGKIELL